MSGSGHRPPGEGQADGGRAGGGRPDGRRPGELCDLETTALVYGGEALGRLGDGTVVLVPYGLPGERLRVRITAAGRGYLRAELLEVRRPSPQRQAARCRHFGDCGGCHYQHLSYPDQLELKRQILCEQLVRIAGMHNPPVEPVAPSPSPWEYRNHVQFHLSENGRLGFRAFRAHRVVPIAECHLPEKPLGQLWPTLQPAGPLGPEAQGQNPAPDGSSRLALRVDSRGRCLIMSEARQELRGLGGEEVLEMSVLGECFQVSPHSFFQVNTRGAETLVRRVLEHCGEGEYGHALDLYCGVGLFSRFLAPRAARTTAVELAASACADFRVNCAALPGLRLLESDAATALALIRDPPQLVVADPPRAGLGAQVIRRLTQWRPETLVYVSCDPATLSRDAVLLLRQGWTLRTLSPVDLFAQTAHIESVSLWRGPGRE